MGDGRQNRECSWSSSDRICRLECCCFRVESSLRWNSSCCVRDETSLRSNSTMTGAAGHAGGSDSRGAGCCFCPRPTCRCHPIGFVCFLFFSLSFFFLFHVFFVSCFAGVQIPHSRLHPPFHIEPSCAHQLINTLRRTSRPPNVPRQLSQHARFSTALTCLSFVDLT